MCRKWPIYILKVHLENLYHARFSFHRQLQFLHISPDMVLYAVLHKNCCTPLIDFKPFPMNFWRKWHLFEHQKRSNRIINKKVTVIFHYYGILFGVNPTKNAPEMTEVRKKNKKWFVIVEQFASPIYLL